MEVSGKRRGENDVKSKHECEPCQGDNVTTNANGFCKDCEEYMCNDCFRQHLRVKSCKHHVLVDAEMSVLPSYRGEERDVKCNKHGGESIRFYCRKHEKVGCGDCMIFEHSACKSEYIRKMSVSFQENEEFKVLMSKIEKLTSENKENEDKLIKYKKDNELMLKVAVRDVRKFRVEFNKYLDKVEADVIFEAKRIISDNNKLLTELDQVRKLLSSKIEKVKQGLDTEAYQENELFINTVECKPLISEIEQAISEVHVKSKTVKEFKFVCDKQLRSIVTSKQRLGTMDISNIVPRHQTMKPTQKKSEKGRTDESSDKEENADEPRKPSTCADVACKETNHPVSQQDMKKNTSSTAPKEQKATRGGCENLSQEDGESISDRRRTRYTDSQQLFVGNVPNYVSEKELRTFFEEFGNVAELRINKKGGPGSKVPNFGFVVFDSPEPVQTILQNKPIKFHRHRLNVEQKMPRESSMERRGSAGGRGGSAIRRTGPTGGGPPRMRVRGLRRGGMGNGNRGGGEIRDWGFGGYVMGNGGWGGVGMRDEDLVGDLMRDRSWGGESMGYGGWVGDGMRDGDRGGGRMGQWDYGGSWTGDGGWR